MGATFGRNAVCVRVFDRKKKLIINSGWGAAGPRAGSDVEELLHTILLDLIHSGNSQGLLHTLLLDVIVAGNFQESLHTLLMCNAKMSPNVIFT